jgi:hypothetical protein
MRSLQAKSAIAARDNPEELLKEIFSNKELAHVQFNYFKKGVLHIKVDSSSWLYYFNIHKNEAIEAAGKKSTLIKDIRFRLGEIT